MFFLGIAERMEDILRRLLMRKMTSIQKVREIVPHNNADALELAMINDWQVVVKKGEFKKDQLVVYFEFKE